jgi:hypothetical protein
MWETVLLSGTEQPRLVVLNRVLMGDVTAVEAATALEWSVGRILAACRKEGAAALAHGNRGRTPAHGLDPALPPGIVSRPDSSALGARGAPVHARNEVRSGPPHDWRICPTNRHRSPLTPGHAMCNVERLSMSAESRPQTWKGFRIPCENT